MRKISINLPCVSRRSSTVETFVATAPARTQLERLAAVYAAVIVAGAVPSLAAECQLLSLILTIDLRPLAAADASTAPLKDVLDHGTALASAHGCVFFALPACTRLVPIFQLMGPMRLTMLLGKCPCFGHTFVVSYGGHSHPTADFCAAHRTVAALGGAPLVAALHAAVQTLEEQAAVQGIGLSEYGAGYGHEATDAEVCGWNAFGFLPFSTDLPCLHRVLSSHFPFALSSSLAITLKLEHR